MTTLTAAPATIADLYAERAAGETTAAMLTDGRDILDISRNDDGTYHLWTSLGEVSNVAGERMIIAPPAPAPVKTITYDRETRDYRMELNGEFVGYAACYHAAEVELDRLAYEQLERGLIEGRAQAGRAHLVTYNKAYHEGYDQGQTDLLQALTDPAHGDRPAMSA